MRARVCRLTPSDSIRTSFKLRDQSASDSSELTASYFPWTCLVWNSAPQCLQSLLGTRHRRIISSSEIIIFLLTLKPLDNRLNTGGLFVWKPQWQSESTIEIICLQWHRGAIWWTFLFLVRWSLTSIKGTSEEPASNPWRWGLFGWMHISYFLIETWTSCWVKTQPSRFVKTRASCFETDRAWASSFRAVKTWILHLAWTLHCW